jgi:hypothetical protein
MTWFRSPGLKPPRGTWVLAKFQEDGHYFRIIKYTTRKLPYKKIQSIWVPFDYGYFWLKDERIWWKHIPDELEFIINEKDHDPLVWECK